MNDRNLTTALPPLIWSDSEVLIAGEFPGALSLEFKRYYSDRRNQFWRILSCFIPGMIEAGYEERLQKLKDNGIAVWDVLRTRGGEEMDVNDFQQLFDRYSALRVVLFNGGKASNLFLMHVAPSLRTDVSGTVRWDFPALPSSSGNNTHQTVQQKAENWGIILRSAGLFQEAAAD
jgi:hypoxanthine-DNA glycosylase